MANELVNLLRADLPRQEEFISAAAVDWSFSDNRVIVNGNTQFSESSMVILKHCFHLALLAASTRHEFFRVPRFLLLDGGIEDGGQEIARSHHLQELVVKLGESLPADHQIIYATLQIAPSLRIATWWSARFPQSTTRLWRLDKRASLTFHDRSASRPWFSFAAPNADCWPSSLRRLTRMSPS